MTNYFKYVVIAIQSYKEAFKMCGVIFTMLFLYPVIYFIGIIIKAFYETGGFFPAFVATIWIIILIAPIALWVWARTNMSGFDTEDNTKEEQEYNDWGFIDYFEKDDKK